MDFRKMSLFALAFTFMSGILFFCLSFDLPVSARGVVIGAGYYPRVFSGLIVIASAIGFVTNYRNKKMSEVKVGIPRPKYFFFVLFLAVAFAAIWQLTGRFYPICGTVVLTLLWFLNPEPASLKKALKTFLTGAVLMLFIFAVFGLLLQLSL